RVHQRGDHRMGGASARQPVVQLALPPVQRRPSRRLGGRPPRAVDDLVRTAHEAVEGVDGGPDVARKLPRRPVVGRVVPPVHSPAGGVGGLQRWVDVDHAPTSATMPSIFDRNLIYITGKGGVGRSTVAGALALAASERGLRTIVCEVAGQGRLPDAFGRELEGPEELELSDGLFATSIDPQTALEEWLRTQ